MKLRAKFFWVTTVIFAVFVAVIGIVSQQLLQGLNQRWGEQVAERQVLFDKYRTLSPLIHEIELARKMAADPAVVAMALHEDDPQSRQQGLRVLEEYRHQFHDRSYFLALARSGHYYFNDAVDQYAGNQLRYTLSAQDKNDSWFFATLRSDKDYQVNLDPDIHLGVTKVWINVLVKQGGQVLGVVGTGIDLTDFLKRTVSIGQSGVVNLFIDGSTAIQLCADPRLIDYASLSKEVSERSKIDRLLTRPQDVEQLRRVMAQLQTAPAGSDQSHAMFWVEFEKQPHLLGVAYLPEVGWFDLTLIDNASLDPLIHSTTLPLLLGGAFLFALFAVGLALDRWVLLPLVGLSAAVERIKRGQLDEPVPLLGKGEVRQLSRAFAEMAESVREVQRGLEQKVAQRTEALQRLAETDTLTGLLNRRGMMNCLHQELARQERQGIALGVLMLDLDFFKQVNDQYGHATGDRVLAEVGKVIQASKRLYDQAARWGGEEFLVLLPECDQEDLLKVAARIHEGVRALRIVSEQGATVSLTLSIGAHHALQHEELDALLQRVDYALYQAKDSGRNCTRML